jgi:hypothetical protein
MTGGLMSESIVWKEICQRCRYSISENTTLYQKEFCVILLREENKRRKYDARTKREERLSHLNSGEKRVHRHTPFHQPIPVYTGLAVA